MAKNSKKKNTVRQYPVKRSINFATVGVEKINVMIAIPAIVAIIILAAIFAKFGVYDVISRANQASAQVNTLRTQVDEANARIEELQANSDEYSHLTYSGFTAEELARADRIKVLSLVEEVVMPASTLNSLNISGNVLTVNITAGYLEEINQIRKNLEQKTNLVSFCTVTTAQTDSRYNYADSSDGVTGQITVYLEEKDDEEEAES